MSNRETWEFTFAGSELLEAVKVQLSSLKISLVTIKKSLDEAKKTLQKQGFEFDGFNTNTTLVDRKLQEQYQTLKYDFVNQEKRQKELLRWAELLAKGTDYGEYQLLFQDYMFFFPDWAKTPIKKPVKAAAKPAEKSPKKEAAKPVTVKKATPPKKEGVADKPKTPAKLAEHTKVETAPTK